MVHFRDEALAYLARIRTAIPESADEAARVPITKLVPAITFRELQPYTNNEWCALDPLDLPSGSRIPRKREMLTARWLLSSFLRSVSDDFLSRSEIPLQVIYVGDGEGDVQFARNLSRVQLPPLRQKVLAFIFDESIQRAEERWAHEQIVTRFSRWRLLEAACIEALRAPFKGPRFVVLDVDRTLLLPKGLADDEFFYVGSMAFKQYSYSFLRAGTQPKPAELNWAYDMARLCFPPYTEVTSAHHKDEDARAFGALALLTGLLADTDLTRMGFLALADWLKLSIRNCKLGGWQPKDAGGFWVSADQIWDKTLLENELRMQLDAVSENRPCTAPLYREYEHQALSRLADDDLCFLNGHVFRIVQAAVEDQAAVPIAYSDRPGISVGIGLYGSGLVPSTAVIKRPLPLRFEGR